jgi:hypothetical protein
MNLSSNAQKKRPINKKILLKQDLWFDLNMKTISWIQVTLNGGDNDRQYARVSGHRVRFQA